MTRERAHTPLGKFWRLECENWTKVRLETEHQYRVQSSEFLAGAWIY